MSFKTSRRDLLVPGGVGPLADWRWRPVARLCGIAVAGVGSARSAGAQTAAVRRQGEIGHLAASERRPQHARPVSTTSLTAVKLAGQEVPESFLKGIKTSTQGGVGKLFVSNKRTWKQYGESGAYFSDLLPNLAQHADKLAFIKSSVTIGATHDISILKLNTGDLNPAARRSAPGSPMPWARPIPTCRPTWCSTAAQGAQRRLGQLELGLPAGGVPGHAVPPGLRPSSISSGPRSTRRAQQRDNLDLLSA
jgi:hypothetical protein